jgi:transposase
MASLVSEEFIRLCVKTLLVKGVEGLKPKKPNGRPSKLTKTQRQELDRLISEGPTPKSFS